MVLQFHQEPPRVLLALAGSDITLPWEAFQVLNQCLFTLSPSNEVLNLTLGPASANFSLGRYSGSGLDRNECGITLLNVQPEISGFIRGNISYVIMLQNMYIPFAYIGSGALSFVELIIASKYITAQSFIE
jgi:hypothetical protein